MGRAIDLDNQPHLVTDEIDDKSAENDLPPESPAKGVSSQMSDRFAIFAPRI
jgi:hypothetical protein